MTLFGGLWQIMPDHTLLASELARLYQFASTSSRVHVNWDSRTNTALRFCDTIRFGPLRFDSIRFGLLRSASVRFVLPLFNTENLRWPLRFASLRFGALHFNTVCVDSLRSTSICWSPLQLHSLLSRKNLHLSNAAYTRETLFCFWKQWNQIRN